MATDTHPIEHDRAVADQRFIADDAAMQHHHVSDCDIASQDSWRTPVAMHDTSVLNIAAGTDLDAFVVRPQHRVEPDTGTGSEDHGTDNLRPGRNVKVIASGQQ